MNNIHFPSVLKAGGAAAAVAIIVLLLSFIPFLGGFLVLCFLCGGFLIPIGAGLAYGHFAPGEEDTAQAAIGGAISGGVSGILLGIFFAIQASISGGMQDGVGGALVAGAFSSLLCSGGLGIMGFVLGALGGIAWPMIQNRNS